MALNDIFTIQEMNLNTKDFLNDIKEKKLKFTGIKNAKNILAITIAEFFAINNLTFRYSYA